MRLVVVAALTGALARASIAAAQGSPAPPAAAPESLAAVASPVLELQTAQVLAAPEGVAPLVELAGVNADALGQVWATDAVGHRLVRWNTRGEWLDETGALGSDPNQFRRPTAIARLGSLGIAVLDVENRRVLAFDLLGRRTDLVIDLDAPELETVTGRVTPVALAADRGSALYVVDSDRDRVLAFDFSAHYQASFGGYGVGAGAFHGLAAIALGARGEIVTLERQLAPRRAATPRDSVLGRAARVQWLDAGGRPLARWTFDAGGARELAVAVDDSARVAIALAGGEADEVRLYDRAGVLLARQAGLAAPRAVAFAPDGSLLVAEAGAAHVRRLRLASARSGK
jgi:hypothetical protein